MIKDFKELLEEENTDEYKKANFALAINKYCDEKEITKEKLAEILNMDVSTVYNHLKNPPKIGSKAWKKYEEILNINSYMTRIYTLPDDTDIELAYSLLPFPMLPLIPPIYFFIKKEPIKVEDVLKKIECFPKEDRNWCIDRLNKGFNIYININPQSWEFLCKYSSLSQTQQQIVKNVLHSIAQNSHYKICKCHKQLIEEIENFKKYCNAEEKYTKNLEGKQALAHKLNQISNMLLTEFYQRLEYLPYLTNEELTLLSKYIMIYSAQGIMVFQHFLEEFEEFNF